jgi:sigma-B regulation protein RsbU (phosphoserine phosphatase)
LKRARVVLERKFYPERLRLRAHFEKFLESPEHLVNRETFWTALGALIKQELMVDLVQPVLAAEHGAEFQLRDVGRTPFGSDSAFVGRLARERRPVLMDELLAAERVQLSDEEHHWISEHRVALVMPLVVHSRLVGFLGIGSKRIDEDYSPEELSILSSYAPQVAMASENVRLVEENVEKRRLEEQMEIARRIQVGFLPNQLPLTPGLEVAAGSRFSLEVAGDYYDVIDLPDGRTVLAIADVSGKGAGAALLMANLQASLRTAIVPGARLAEAVGRVNDLIFRNTPPEQYITFAVGTYDPQLRTLTHVNAGHNRPLIVRADGTIQQLETGGLILGCLRGTPYEAEVVKLSAGDLLLMYTDGVSEAMNAADEEYGEQRITEFVRQHRSLPPLEIMRLLEADVLRFCGREPVEDDRTLLLARVVCE